MTASALNGRSPSNGAGNGGHVPSPLDAFLLDVLDVARSVDVELAEILGDGGGEPSSKPWTGTRRRGLELCLNMLRYARDEVARGEDGRKLDRGMDYIQVELDMLD